MNVSIVHQIPGSTWKQIMIPNSLLHQEQQQELYNSGPDQANLPV